MLILIRIIIIIVVFSITTSPLGLQPHQSSGQTYSNSDNTIGQMPLVSNRASQNEIYVMNADGTNQTRLTFNEGDSFSPEWSPDGQEIAFLSHHTQNNSIEIYVMDADGTNQVRLTRANLPEDDNSDIAWSPNGQHIAFASNRSDDPHNMFWQIYVMNADGTNQMQLTDSRFPHR